MADLEEIDLAYRTAKKMAAMIFLYYIVLVAIHQK